MNESVLGKNLIGEEAGARGGGGWRVLEKPVGLQDGKDWKEEKQEMTFETAPANIKAQKCCI